MKALLALTFFISSFAYASGDTFEFRILKKNSVQEEIGDLVITCSDKRVIQMMRDNIYLSNNPRLRSYDVQSSGAIILSYVAAAPYFTAKYVIPASSVCILRTRETTFEAVK